MGVDLLRICITPPSILSNAENFSDSISNILEKGLADVVHLRLPEVDEEIMRKLILGISSSLRRKVTLHDHFNLAAPLNCGGIHINSRNPFLPSGITEIRVSKSCHSLEEVKLASDEGIYDYVTLSPIFDSISKENYKSNFTQEELAVTLPQIDLDIVALGGVRESYAEKLCRLGFKGMAMLGEFKKYFA